MTRKSSRALCFVLSLCAYALCVPVFAQTDPINSDIISGYGLRNLQNAVIITASPATPGAGETVHLTVEGPIHDLPKDAITWTINGKQVANGLGQTSTDAVVDATGDPLDVSVSVVDAVWGVASSELTLVPLQLDILYDGPTYVPPFYRGRALPSGGGTVRLQAITRFVQNGQPIPNSEITFTWSQNGRVLGNISGPGNANVVLDTSSLYGADTISVRATAKDETLSSNASVVIPNNSTFLALYEDHPLFGVTYFNALPAQNSIPNEITVAAIPYFATANSVSDPTLQFTWLVNNAPVTASSKKSNEITINTGQDIARVHLDVASSRNFFLSAASDWGFIFGNAGGSSIQKPGTNDAFHNSQL